MENLERVMEEEREWKGKNKGDGLEFRGGVYDGGKVGRTRGWLGRALWGVGRQCGVRLFEVAVGKQRSPQGEGCKVWECRVSSVKFKV